MWPSSLGSLLLKRMHIHCFTPAPVTYDIASTPSPKDCVQGLNQQRKLSRGPAIADIDVELPYTLHLDANIYTKH